ncbi:5-bromo-4-chloroindolyl phosphate hydrolysis family protein [Jeotgalibacillus proteolyticus]|uniref:5-bromo-4-chloroindolyl phosphate hydrolysis family protein n=1 Tax=Jeotgalibacillus proteolyticus TaxID=2082395 RepID=UPI003CF1D1EF
MREFLYFLARAGIALPLFLLTWITAYYIFNIQFFYSILIAIAGGVIPFYLIKWFQHRSILRSYKLSAQEYQYIQQNLKDAQKKLSRLQGRMFQIRSLSAMRQFNDLTKLSRKIFAVVKKDPKRFYLAERFFFYHLDSAVELTDKYTTLAVQPIKNKEVLTSLDDTRKTLLDLNSSLEEELMNVLTNDIDTLRVELDLAQMNLQRGQQSREGIE